MWISAEETSNQPANMNLRNAISRKNRGYTLVEVLVASAIFMLGISAACCMSLSMAAQEEMNFRVSRALNLHENAGRLYQLGLAPTAITGQNGILPASADIGYAWADASVNVAGVGSLAGQTITATIYPTPPPSNAPTSYDYWTGGAPIVGGTRESRTNVITIYRSDIP
jgi:prepilin-type N-terminal cleavage/methylation domain-containing protein